MLIPFFIQCYEKLSKNFGLHFKKNDETVWWFLLVLSEQFMVRISCNLDQKAESFQQGWLCGMRRTCVGVMVLTSSDARHLSSVVLPALSRPNRTILSSSSVDPFSFCITDSRPWGAQTPRFSMQLKVEPFYWYDLGGKRRTGSGNVLNNLGLFTFTICIWLLPTCTAHC